MLISSLIYFFIGFVATIVVVRAYVSLYPQTNVYIEGYNVHHLYTGALFLVVLSIVQSAGLGTNLVILFSGVASGLIIDQLVYLVTSKGGHRAYFGPVSVWGMVVLSVALVCLGFFVSILVS